MKKRVYDVSLYSSVVLERLSGSVPATLRPRVATVKTALRAYERKRGAVESAEAARDAVLESIALADAGLDVALNALADAMVGAGLGTRQNPFGKFGKLSPGRITRLAYATEVREVMALAGRLKKASLSPTIARHLQACVKAAGEVSTLLTRLSKPAHTYQRSLGERDEALVPLTRAFARLRTFAKAAFFEQPGRYDELFEKPDDLVAPRRHRAAKKADLTAVPREAPAAVS